MALFEKSADENPVAIYCDAYKIKYGHNPVIGGKQSGILKRFKKNHPAKWKDLIEGFLKMPDSWAVQRSHPTELLESKINEIMRFLETGKVVTQSAIKQFNQKLDQKMGPEPTSIEKILARKKQIEGNS